MGSVKTSGQKSKVALLAATVLIGFAVASPGYAENKSAVVPTRIIYPGEALDPATLQEVEVTNPNLAGNYARQISQVAGKITDRTLLPGRTIIVDNLREPYAVKRGNAVKIIYSSDGLTISTFGTPMEDAGVGEIVKVRNTESGITVSGTVMQDGSIKVLSE